MTEDNQERYFLMSCNDAKFPVSEIVYGTPYLVKGLFVGLCKGMKVKVAEIGVVGKDDRTIQYFHSLWKVTWNRVEYVAAESEIDAYKQFCWVSVQEGSSFYRSEKSATLVKVHHVTQLYSDTVRKDVMKKVQEFQEVEEQVEALKSKMEELRKNVLLLD
jgi:hypothetical protein